MKKNLPKLRFASLWLFLIYSTTILNAQKLSPKFEYVSLDKGLSPKTILCILQDSKGFMWFGTMTGLYKYDGYNFTVFKHDRDNPYSLSDDSVTSLCEDRVGNLWIGTGDAGLNRFDQRKKQFIHYLPDSNNSFSISDNRIMAICEDQTGKLWIGTQRGGLNQLVLQNLAGEVSAKFIHYKHNPKDSNSISNNDIRSLLIDRFGNLWIGTEHGGVNVLDLKTKKITHLRQGANDGYHLLYDQIASLYEDKSGLIWISTLKGMNRFNPKTGYISKFGFDPANPNSLNEAYIWSITEDLSGNFWFGGEVGFGLYKYEPQSNRTIHFQGNLGLPDILRAGCINSVYKDRAGLLWFGTWNGGLYKYNPIIEQFGHVILNSNVKFGSSENWVNTILEDHLGRLWVGTETGDVKRLLPNSKPDGEPIFKTYKKKDKKRVGLYNNSISVIREDKNGKFWIGTFKNGLSTFDPETGRFTYFNPNPKAYQVQVVQSLYIDRSGLIWIGSLGGGIYLYDPSTNKFMNYLNIPGNSNSFVSNRIYTIYEDSKSRFWIGTAGGLDRLIFSIGKGLDRKINIKHYKPNPNDSTSISNNDVLSILEDKSGVLWVGTEGGLNKLQLVGTHSNTSSSINKNEVTQGFTHYTVKNGLPDNVINGILEDNNGNIWLSTNKGLSKFNPKTEIFKNYYVANGLQSNKFNKDAFLKRKNGMLCFGGMNGFNMFNPDSIIENRHVPKIAITDFQFLNQSIKTEDNPLQKYSIDEKEINLTYKDYLMSFEFSALDFTNPLKNKYMYMMEGLENNWNYIGNRHFVTFTTLPPGDYTFKVKGTNSDGIWNEEGTSIKISVAPPPWKTWWAYLLYLAGVISIVLGYVRFKTKEHRKELEYQKHQLDLQRKNEIVQKKVIKAIEKEKEVRRIYTQKLLTVQEEQCRRISNELHDSVGQDLLVVKNLISLGKNNNINVIENNSYYDKIVNSASRAIDEVRDISRALHPVQLEKLGLTLAIKSVIDRFKETTEIACSSSVDDINGILKKESEIHLYRIVQESLNNATKHSKAENVSVVISKKTDSISLSIEDDGVGFDFSKTEKTADGLGLNSISERVNLLNGKLEIKTGLNKGTHILVTLEIGTRIEQI